MIDDEVSIVLSLLLGRDCFVQRRLHRETVSKVIVCHGFIHNELVLFYVSRDSQNIDLSTHHPSSFGEKDALHASR